MNGDSLLLEELGNNSLKEPLVFVPMYVLGTISIQQCYVHHCFVSRTCRLKIAVRSFLMG